MFGSPTTAEPPTDQRAPGVLSAPYRALTIGMVALIEVGNPENNLILGAMYTLAKLGVNLRTQRYGQVTSLGTAATNAFGPLEFIE